jgi:hypothetical protein
VNPKEAITAAVPGSDPIAHRVRLALFVALNAGQLAEKELEYFVFWLEKALENPPWSVFWYGPTGAEDLATHLENLARELRSASAAMDAAKKFMLTNADSALEGKSVHGATPKPSVSVRPADAGPPPTDDCPF